LLLKTKLPQRLKTSRFQVCGVMPPIKKKSLTPSPLGVIILGISILQNFVLIVVEVV